MNVCEKRMEEVACTVTQGEAHFKKLFTIMATGFR